MVQAKAVKPTRMIFLGGPLLTDGFRLIGFETLTDPSVAQTDELISGLLHRNENAFLVIEQTESLAASRMLQQVRNEGGRIVITDVPTLQDPSCLHCELDKQIEKLMGGSQSILSAAGAREPA